jgi:hypothetical protein
LRPGRCSCSRSICREEPVFAGKVTCGVRSETSGQSWPSNTVATDRSVHRAKPEFKVWQRYPAETSGRLAAKDFVPSVSNAWLHGDGSTWSLELFTFLPNQPRQRPFCSRDGRGSARLPATARLPVRKPGPVRLVCRENLALSTALSSVTSPSKAQL